MLDDLKTFEAGGRVYSVGRMNPFVQWHVMRRLAPLLAGVLPVLLQNGMTEEQLRSMSLMDIVGMLAVPLADVLARMNDADSEYVLRACLAVCRRKIEESGTVAWAAVQNASGQLQYEDLSMTEMLRIAVEAVKSNLGSFFPTGL